MPNKLTDAEVKKALECVLQSNNGLDKNNAIIALDLINRQEVRIHQQEKIIMEIQNANLIDFKATIGNYIEENESLKAEVERLKANEEMAEGYADALVEYTKAEAYKQFADELARRLGFAFLRKHNCVLDIMENLLNELVGDTDGKEK